MTGQDRTSFSNSLLNDRKSPWAVLSIESEIRCLKPIEPEIISNILECIDQSLFISVKLKY